MICVRVYVISSRVSACAFEREGFSSGHYISHCFNWTTFQNIDATVLLSIKSHYEIAQHKQNKYEVRRQI